MTKAICEIFSRCKIEELGDALAAGEVTALAVSHDQNAMQCHVRFPKPVHPGMLSRLEQQIAKTYQLTRLNISPRYEMEQLTSDYIDILQDTLLYDHPSTKGLLADSRW